MTCTELTATERATTTVGIVGVGEIASALVTAVSEGPGASGWRFMLSPRSLERSTSLAARYPGVVVAHDNQQVVDSAEIVLLAVLPEQLADLCASLTFRADQVVVGLAAGWPPSRLQPHLAPARAVCQMIPLPMVTQGTGPVVLFPEHSQVLRLLEGCGTVLVPDRESELAVLNSLSAVMSTYFQLQQSLVHWAETKGLSRDVSIGYVTSLFAGLAAEGSSADPAEWERLPATHETPGGWNEQVRLGMANLDAFTGLERVLDELLSTRAAPAAQADQ